MHAVGFQSHKGEFQVASALDMRTSWHDYWTSRTSKWRNNITRDKKRLASLGHVEFVRHRPMATTEGGGEPAWDLYDACVRTASQSWQGQRQDGTTLSSGRVEAFLRDAHVAAARLGMLDMNVLMLDGEPAAFAYNYHHDGRIAGLRTGFDPDVCTAGAGSALLVNVIEDGFSRGDTHYDLGVDYHGYKRAFRTHVETSYRFTHYRGSLRAQGVRLSRWWRSNVAARC
jgi:CelD/BcsL family acetyltransferase involved in cellulose biosynthesis